VAEQCSCASTAPHKLLTVTDGGCVYVCSELVKISWQEQLMRTVCRHADRLSECLSAVKTADVRKVSTVPTMFGGDYSQRLAVQLVCTLLVIATAHNDP